MTRKNLSTRKGFSLIDLMVSLSICSIGIIVALPNYSDATTRAQVSAVKNNMRVAAIKFDMFKVDTNRYPLAAKWPMMMLYIVPTWRDEPKWEDRWMLANKYMYGQHHDLFSWEQIRRYGYQDYAWLAHDGQRQYVADGFNFFQPDCIVKAMERGCEWQNSDIKAWRAMEELCGTWVLYSPGPDIICETPSWIDTKYEYDEWMDVGYTEKKLLTEYDVTNGTVSYGNIFRSQKNAAGLGSHPYLHGNEQPEEKTEQ